jgi:phosphopantetheine--protein transferase-like protein
VNILVGCDLVFISKFEERLKLYPDMMQKMFTPHEIASGKTYSSLAGKFAAKEATIKALGLLAGQWLSIEILSSASGKPFVKVLFPEPQISILNHDISISHDGQYAMAMCVFVIK